MAEAKNRLSRESIIEAAFSFIDDQGLQALSMRNLASKFGVSAMALYSYFNSREEIVDEACAKLMRLIDTAPIPGERWDDTVRRTTASIRDVSLRHPNLVEVMNSSAAWSPPIREHTKKINALHTGQKIPVAVLTRMWGIIDAFLTGFIENETRVIIAQKLPLENQTEQWVEIVATAYTDEAFSDGIEIIIAGIRGILAPDPCEWHTPYSEE